MSQSGPYLTEAEARRRHNKLTDVDKRVTSVETTLAVWVTGKDGEGGKVRHIENDIKDCDSDRESLVKRITKLEANKRREFVSGGAGASVGMGIAYGIYQFLKNFS